ncbi:MAG TPA: hypothetical protein VIP10_08015 [Burkholderiaceae bacterium]
MSKLSSRLLGALAAAVLWASGSGAASAAAPVGVNLTFEGCRNNGGLTLPDANGKFICPDAAYTTGNLGKGWNELDLVPHRITLAAGSGGSVPAMQTYRLAVAVDHLEGGVPGYDVLSAPIKNAGKSAGSCAITPSAQSTLTPGIGGTDTTMYRFIEVTQARGTTCVFDFYARLALGSHLYPGSSLHANTFNETFGTGGIGARDISIPVKEILPQDLDKTMSALADSDFSWTLKKEGPANIDFGDVCRADATYAKPATISVAWVKEPAPLGMITIKTIITATNPAARTIVVDVTDKIYKGLGQTTQIGATGVSGPVPVPANTSMAVLTHTVVVDSATAGALGDSLNDVAVATYTDLVTGVAVPGTTTATATTTIQSGGGVTNGSASIADIESITGTDLSFAVSPLPAGGSIPPGYVAGTKVTALDWLLAGQTSSGSMTFAKTVHLATQRVVSGTLSDKAGLAGSNGFVANSNELIIPVTSSATVKVKGTKSIPLGLLTGAQTLVVKFAIKGVDDPTTTAEKTVTFTAGGPLSQTFEFAGLKPDAYDLTEVSALVNGTDPSGLVPDEGATQQVNLRLGTGGAVLACEKSVTFTNVLRGGTPKVQVNKVTDPTTLAGADPTNYTFKLYGPPNATTLLGTVVANANGASELFPINLTEPGGYAVVEDPLPTDPWFYFSKSAECAFTLVYPDSFTSGKTYSCTYTNKKKGTSKVVKTVSGAAPTGAQSFTFELRQNATVYASGSTLETKTATAANGGVLNFATLLTPGATYQMCESNMLPGWQSTLTGFVPNSLLPDNTPNPGVDNSTRCVNFTAGAGTTTEFVVNNTPPPEGDARTIGYWKNHASCASSSLNKNNPTKLDETLFAALPNGILQGTRIDSLVFAGSTPYGLYGQNATSTVDCAHTVSLLDKRSFNGQKKASDPLFNMAAQLVAAELNVIAGASTCVNPSIAAANTLLGNRSFDGNGYSGKLTPAEAQSANTLATILDKYNNNMPGGC